MTLPKAIFFDWDGTLADSYAFLEGAHNTIRQEFGMPPFKTDEFRDYFGQPRETLYPIIYGAANVETAKEKFGKYVVDNHKEHLKQIEGAGELLATAHDLGIVMGVISNKKSEYLHLEIESFGWTKYFKVVLGAGDAANDKPSADPLNKAVQEAGFNSMENILYVGDTDVDLQCAKNAGCEAVFFAHDWRSEAWIATYKPSLIFKKCAEMRRFLLQC